MLVGRKGGKQGHLGLIIFPVGILLAPVTCPHGHKASVKTLAWCWSASLEPGGRLDFWHQGTPQ